jgi:sec-independent protein translocase protein TatA
MFGGIGMQEILVILLIVLLVFGAKRLPELGQALGRGIREFKRGVSDIEEELKSERPRSRVLEQREEPRALGEPRAVEKKEEQKERV